MCNNLFGLWKGIRLYIQKTHLRGCCHCLINHTRARTHADTYTRRCADKHSYTQTHIHSHPPTHSNTRSRSTASPLKHQKPCKTIPVHAGTNKRTQEAYRPISQNPPEEMQECSLTPQNKLHSAPQ